MLNAVAKAAAQAAAPVIAVGVGALERLISS